MFCASQRCDDSIFQLYFVGFQGGVSFDGFACSFVLACHNNGQACFVVSLDISQSAINSLVSSSYHISSAAALADKDESIRVCCRRAINRDRCSCADRRVSLDKRVQMPVTYVII